MILPGCLSVSMGITEWFRFAVLSVMLILMWFKVASLFVFACEEAEIIYGMYGKV